MVIFRQKDKPTARILSLGGDVSKPLKKTTQTIDDLKIDKAIKLKMEPTLSATLYYST